MSAHCVHRCVVRRDDAVGDVELESLETHDLFFDRVLGDKSVDIDGFLLPDSMRAVHCLQVHLRIPVVFDKDHRVGAC